MTMTSEDRKLEMSKFFRKRENKISVKHPVSETKVPWYRRPLDKSEFTYKFAKNGRYYARHNEWSKRVWIGPYKDISDVNSIIDSYVTESLKGSLNRGYNEEIHSVIIEDPEEFF